MHRLIGGKRAVRIIPRDPFLNPAARHAENAVGVAAERFMVHEVAPSADALSDQEADRNNVVGREQAHLAQLADDRTDEKCTDDAAVDRETAVPDVEDRFPVARVAVPVEDDVVQARADDAADDTADDAVDRAVCVNAEASHALERIHHCKHHADRDEHAVPCDRCAEHRKGDAVYVKFQPQLREPDQIRIDCCQHSRNHSIIPFSCYLFCLDLRGGFGSMTERQMLSCRNRSRRQLHTSSGVSCASTSVRANGEMRSQMKESSIAAHAVSG